MHHQRIRPFLFLFVFRLNPIQIRGLRCRRLLHSQEQGQHVANFLSVSSVLSGTGSAKRGIPKPGRSQPFAEFFCQLRLLCRCHASQTAALFRRSHCRLISQQFADAVLPFPIGSVRARNLNLDILRHGNLRDQLREHLVDGPHLLRNSLL